MAIKTDQVLMGVAAGGFTLLGAWLLYSEYEKNKHINEFIEKAKKAEVAYQRDIDADDYEGAQNTAQFYEQLMYEEEQVINAKGWGYYLVDALTKLGIVAFGGAISYKVITYLMKKYPPKNYQPPGSATAVVTTAVPAGESAFRKLSRYWKGLVNSFAGVPEWMTEESWAGLPNGVIIALAVAAAIILALIAWWLWLFIPEAIAGLRIIMGMAKFAPAAA